MPASFVIMPQTAKITAIVRGKCLVTMEKASHLRMENTNRKPVLTDGNALRQKDFSKGSPDTSDHSHIFSYSALLSLFHFSISYC